ncbi:MAG: hemolysin family protein [Chloroherpetonaceae bacterium]|nr:hemolysin family protein [Chloroherpetonaceae bacterium]MDW8437282.1 hemolysin family protein [Chloroherpetonaceae bacterium]
MSHVAFEVALIVALILANGLFALAEIAIVSSKKTRLEQLAQKGDEGAKVALELANSPERFLSTVQVGITLIGVLAGAFGGATLAEPLSERLSQWEFLDEYSESVSLGVVVSAITFLSIVVGELAPKRVALSNPETIARVVAKPMLWLSKAANPIVKILSGATSLITNALGIKSNPDSPVTEEEVRIMIALGTKSGEFEPVEQELINRIFKLSDRRVSELMTPKNEILWIDVNDSEKAIRDLVLSKPHAAFPVGDDSLDRIIGVVRAKDILVAMEKGEPLNIRAMMKKPTFFLESLSAFRVFEKLRKIKPQLAIVIDEYGATQGLITLNDILGGITGDIDGETVEPYAIQRDDGSWLIEGLMPIRDFKEQFNIAELPNEDSGYETVAGFVMHQLGAIPKEGQAFSWNGARFEVVDMDGRRVDKILYAPAQKAK